MFVRMISSLLLLYFFVSCAVNPVTGKRELMLVSEEQEIQMGKEYDPQISAMYGVYDDPALQKYVNEIGAKMEKISHRPNLPYEIKVMDSPVINAFAVPGGYVYITRGILAYLDNEAALAGVIGHEIGHIAARHSAKQISKQQLAQLGLGIGSVVSETFAQYAGIAEQGLGLLFLKFSRDNERQADELGVEYSTKAGYDAHEMSKFFKVLDAEMRQATGGKSLPDWQSTHPNPADRVVDVAKETEQWEKKVPMSNYKVNRDEYLRHLDGLVVGENPRQGFIENNMFYHPDLKIQFPVPAGWTINNLPTQVQMIAGDQKAIMLFKMGESTNAKNEASNFVSKNQLTVTSQKSVDVHGAPAEELNATLTTDQGVIQLLCFFISKDGAVYTFIGYSAQTDFNNYRAAFRGTMTNLETVRDRSILSRQPDQMRIKKTPRTMTWKDALKHFGSADDQLTNLALMNGNADLNATVNANTLIKVIESGK